MADNVAITPGSGASIATDDCGASGHTQVVKLAISANADATPIPADATNGLDVDVTRTVPPVPAVVTMQNAATANGDGTSLDVSGYGLALLSITGTFGANVRFEGSIDDTNWALIYASSNSQGNSAPASGTSNAMDVILQCGGYKSVRARIESYTSGSITVKGRACAAGSAVQAVNITGSVGLTGGAAVIANGGIAHDGIDSGNPVKLGGYASAAAPSDVSGDGDRVNGWFLRNGAQATVLTAAGALVGGDATNGLDVDVTRVSGNVAVTLAAGAAAIAKAEDVASASADVGVPAMAVRKATPANLSDTDADYEMLQMSAGRLWVSNDSAGDVAHDGPDSGNPIKVGGQARTTNRTAVANGDRSDFICDDMGRQVVVSGQVRDLIAIQHTQIASSAAETTIMSAVASTFLDLTMLILTNQTGTAVNVTIKDSTGGTTRMVIALAANGGAVIPFPRPVPQATVNNNWTATLSSAAVTVNIFVQAEKNI